MLASTFVHVPRIGYATERRLWSIGVLTWQDFLNCRGDIAMSHRRRESVEKFLESSIDALREVDLEFFRTCLPRREYWRLYPELRHSTAFLDIETTGTLWGDDQITMIGLYDGRRMRTFVQGYDLEDFLDEVDKYEVLVTFNGGTFDLPFIEKQFRGFRFRQFHVDLRWVLKRLAFSGGLKAIEHAFGIERPEEIRHLDGFDAVRLWQKWVAGDRHALETLTAYNRADTENLKKLLDAAYASLRTELLGKARSSVRSTS